MLHPLKRGGRLRLGSISRLQQVRGAIAVSRSHVIRGAIAVSRSHAIRYDSRFNHHWLPVLNGFVTWCLLGCLDSYGDRGLRVTGEQRDGT